MTHYDNPIYWIKRGKKYKDEFSRHDIRTTRIFRYQEQRLIDELDELKFETVLEVGCGFGRIIKKKPKLEQAIFIAEKSR